MKKRVSFNPGLLFERRNVFGVLIVTALMVAVGLCATSGPAHSGEQVRQTTSGAKDGKRTVHLCTQMPTAGEKLGLPRSNKWPPGYTLRARLLGGSAIIRAKVQEFAVQWNQFSGVTIQFVPDGEADIRVSFVPDNTSWSYVGTDSLGIPAEKATMNFGWLTDNTADEEFSRVVLHEFGHALGCIHEHQSPDAGIPWDKPKVYDYYRQNYGWSQAEVDQNIFRRYDATTTQFSAFDARSIMLYSIPAALTTNGYTVGWNRVLSSTDKRFIATAYPKNAPPMLPGDGPKTGALAATISETGLEAGRPVVKTAPVLKAEKKTAFMAAPQTAPAVPVSATAPRDLPRLTEARLGKLENYIRNNPSILKAQQLRSDPRVNSLSAASRADFLNEYSNLMFAKVVPSRDSLLDRTRILDKDQIEMEERSFKHRDDVAAFRSDEAALDAEIREHNKKVAAYEADKTVYEQDAANYTATLADYTNRLNTHNAEAAAHNAETADYARECVGAPLPPGPYARCQSWYQTLSARASQFNARKAGLDDELAGLKQTVSALNARRDALQQRFDDAISRKAALDVRREALEKKRTELLAEETKLADWQRLIQPQWDFELNRIEEWRTLVDRFNGRLEKALADVKAPKERVAQWSGNWDKKEKDTVNHAFNAVKDEKLKAWIVANTEFGRYGDDFVSPLSADGSILRFKDSFFTKTSAAQQENLIAFEAGKVFYGSMKDLPVQGGKTLEQWFIGYYGERGHASAIADMKATKHQDERVATSDLVDAYSAFAHIFRAQALQLEKPRNQREREEWDGVIRDFQSQVNPLLQGRQ